MITYNITLTEEESEEFENLIRTHVKNCNNNSKQEKEEHKFRLSIEQKILSKRKKVAKKTNSIKPVFAI